MARRSSSLFFVLLFSYSFGASSVWAKTISITYDSDRDQKLELLDGVAISTEVDANAKDVLAVVVNFQRATRTFSALTRLDNVIQKGCAFEMSFETEIDVSSVMRLGDSGGVRYVFQHKIGQGSDQYILNWESIGRTRRFDSLKGLTTITALSPTKSLIQSRFSAQGGSQLLNALSLRRLVKQNVSSQVKKALSELEGAAEELHTDSHSNDQSAVLERLTKDCGTN